MNEIEILSDLVKFNTIEDKENNEILNYIEKYYLNLGFKTEVKKKYLVMTYGDNPRVGFLGHSDTVEFIDGWKTNPHTLTRVGDMLYGLGACDMKGGVAAFMQAVSEIDLDKLKNGIKVIITYDEEIGFKGIYEVVNDKVKLPEYMIFGEPTNNDNMTGCKGLFSVRMFTNGIKVHSSTPERGKSANSAMIRILTELEDYYKENVRQDLRDIYEVPYTTMNIGLIDGGSAINSVSAKCMSYVDFRTVDEKHRNMLEEKIKELCNKYDGTYEIDVDVKSFNNDIDFVKEKKTAGFMTEASFVDKKRMILGVGPMTAHEIDEHCSVESLRKCVEQYKEIILNVCN